MGCYKTNREMGVVYVEFLIAILPLLTLFLCLIQLGLILSAGILVKFAAGKAARSAIVVLSDEHEDADYEEPLHQVGNGGAGVAAYRGAGTKSRYETIRMAARFPLAAVSPSLESLGAGSVQQSLQQGELLDLAIALTGWTRFAVGLGFSDAEGNYISKIGSRDVVSVKVVFLFPCLVPMGREIACGPYGALPRKSRELLEVNGRLVGWTRFLNWRFAALSAGASLPNQGRR